MDIEAKKELTDFVAAEVGEAQHEYVRCVDTRKTRRAHENGGRIWELRRLAMKFGISIGRDF